jgi:hypothetical protein
VTGPGGRITARRAFWRGLHAAGGRPQLIAAVWAWHLVLATVGGAPVFRWLFSVTSRSPATDPLLDQWSLALFADLFQYDRAPLISMGMTAALSTLLIGALTAPLVLGTTIESFAADAPVRISDAFAQAIRRFWPLLRLILVGRVIAVAGAVLTVLVLIPLTRVLERETWELGWLYGGVVRLACGALVGVLLWSAVDMAAMYALRANTRRTRRAWINGLGFVARRPLFTLGVWLGAGLLTAVAAALFLVPVVSLVPGTTVSWIAVAILLQQLFVICRLLLRVALLGAEWTAVPETWTPVAAPTAQEVERLDIETVPSGASNAAAEESTMSGDAGAGRALVAEDEH